MEKGIESVYKHHHQNRPPEFAVFGDARGNFFSSQIGKGKKVLDLGCRDGTLAKYFLEGNRVWGIDIDNEALGRAAEKGITTRQVDLNGSWDILNGEKFDAVVAAEVLEHLYFPEIVLDKINDVLNSGGVLVGSIPNAFSLKNRIRLLLGKKRYTTLGDPTHINHFSFNDLNNALKKKFTEVKIKPLVRKPFGPIARLMPGLIAYDFIFSAKKI
ncbi:MAG: class I SAM-dependent methyltransferase [Candidatus Pacebacteria bacterium]|nr:class I SAM-dependent methyltransferase [Candidatus Paceibacterota bacterium]